MKFKFKFRKPFKKESVSVDTILCVLWKNNDRMTVPAICKEIESYFGMRYSADEILEKLDEARNEGLITVQEAVEGSTYYPTMSEAAYNEEKLREYEELMAAYPGRSYVMPISAPKITEEQYERLKKLIDELED